MREISQYNSDAVKILQSQEQSISQRRHAQFRQSALRAVSAENKLASVDRSDVDLSSRKDGSFKFDYTKEVQVQWQGSYKFDSGPPATFESNFSFSASITETLSVEFGQGISADAEQIQGEDFSFDRQGMLTLLQQLIDKLNAQDQPQLDLGGEIDQRAMELLQQLGLIDEEGQATPLLQLLSDYAGLNRFQAGQQVNNEAKTSYGPRLNSLQLGWQGWQQQQAAAANSAGGTSRVASAIGGANTIAGSNVGGNVNIDDRDVININITTDDD